MSITRLTEETAARLAWEHLRSARRSKRAINEPTVLLITGDQWARFGLDNKTEWLVSFPLRVPRGMKLEHDAICVVVDDRTGECREPAIP